jgi:antitoxin (DNA-binding transcriptional repressor) of toxin-antitoxin stability system
VKNTVTATELARNVGDILARIRYRRESFVVERNGRPIARLIPIEAGEPGTVREALAGWAAGAADDPTFADDLARVNAADRPAANPWAS